MEPKICSALSDSRPIRRVNNDEQCMTLFTVGIADVTRIEVYGENGEMAYIPFIAVFKNNEELPFCRMPMKNLTIYY